MNRFEFTLNFGNIDEVRALLMLGADPDKKDEQGYGLMDLARQQEQDEVIQWLSARQEEKQLKEVVEMINDRPEPCEVKSSKSGPWL